MHKLLLPVFFLLVSVGFGQQKPWPQQMADSVIERWPQNHTDNVNHPHTWNYEQSVLLTGMESVWYETGDAKYFHYIQDSMDQLVQPDGSIPTYHPEEQSLDLILLGRQFLMLYGVTQDRKYYEAATQLRKQLQEQPRTVEGGFSHKTRSLQQRGLDGLYMTEPFYAQYATTVNEPHDFDDITHQFVLAEQHTRDAQSSLLYRAWNSTKRRPRTNNTMGDSQILWSQAMDWYAMALVDTLPYFPQDHPGRVQLLAILNRLAVAITAHQDAATGLWYKTTDKLTAEDNYPEASVSCMFTYALAKGVRLGYLPKRYQANTEKAWQGILKKFIKKDATGLSTLSGTAKSAGLGGIPEQGGSYRYDVGEKVIANDSKGIGAFLLAASEMQMAPEATSGHSTHVIMDAWFNSQMRRNAAGQMASFHYKWNDLSNSGFSFFGHVFRSYGAETDTLYVAPTVENLKDANIYLIVSPDIPAKNPNPHYVQPVDVEAVVDWVRRGGVLVMMENDGPNAEFEHLNSLSERFGIHFNPVCRNRVQGKNFKMGKVPVAAGEPIFQNAHTFYMKEISTITPQKPAKSILIDKGDTLMATARFGKGTVFAVVDPWLYNEYTDGRKLPSEYDNYAGAQELASWLIAQSQHGTHRLPKGRSK